MYTECIHVYTYSNYEIHNLDQPWQMSYSPCTPDYCWWYRLEETRSNYHKRIYKRQKHRMKSSAIMRRKKTKIFRDTLYKIYCEYWNRNMLPSAPELNSTRVFFPSLRYLILQRRPPWSNEKPLIKSLCDEHL